MNQFTNRQRQIITIISENNTPIPDKKISSLLDISVRTIQNEIRAINRKLHLIQSTNKGYTITPEVYHQLDISTTHYVPEETEILKKLIFADTSFQIDEFAESFYISTSTLENRFRKYNKELAPFDLKIQREKGYISILGEEKKRSFIQALISKELNASFNPMSDIHAYFNDTDTDHIECATITILYPKKMI